MRASRLVSLLLLLQARGQLTAAELAAELEVSERTIHRDVEALSASGVPIYAERGSHGGFRLVDGYRTRLTGMTGDEAEALFLAGLPGPAAELGLGTVVAAAQLKVLASLPPELRARASRLVERFHLDAGEWFRASQPVPHLAALSEAVWNATRITIEYDRGEGATRRVLEPLGLVLKAGIWYVVAAVDGQIRTYRVSRVVAAEPGEERFERPDGLRPRLPTGPNRRPPTSATCRASRSTSGSDPTGSATCATPSAARDESRAETLDGADPDGWLRLRLRLDWPDEAHAEPARRRSLGRGPRPARGPRPGRLDGSRDRRALWRRARLTASARRPRPSEGPDGRPRASRAGGLPRGHGGVPAGAWPTAPGTSQSPSWVVRDPFDRGSTTVSAIPARTCQE